MTTITDIYKNYISTLFISLLKANKGIYQAKYPRKVSFGDMTNILRQNGLQLTETQEDVWFYLPSWLEFKSFADSFLAKLLPFIPYIPEIRDCDNFAELVKSFTSLFMEVNSCGKVHCKVYHKDTGGLIAGHSCDAIITRDNEVYIYDFNNQGLYTKYEKGKKLIMKNWEYREFDRSFWS